MAVMRWDSFVGTLTGIGHVTPNMIRATFVVDGGYVPIRPGDESVVLYFSRDGVALRTEQSDGPESFGGWEVADTERSEEARAAAEEGTNPEEWTDSAFQEGSSPAPSGNDATEPEL